MNILIKEAQPLTAFGIHQLLEHEFKDVTVNLVNNVDEAFKLFYKKAYDVFIVDTEHSLAETEQLIKAIRNRHELSKILVYGNVDSAVNEFTYISMGANGFITKRSKSESLVSAIHLIRKGQVYISQKALKQGQIGVQGIQIPQRKLSRRELEVYRLLIKGLSVNGIAESLELKQTTISTIKRRILTKMKVSNIAELVLQSTKIGHAL